MEQYNLLIRIVEVFDSLEIRYFVTGSIASIFYGEPRFTNDIDIVANVEEKDAERICESFSSKEFYVDKNMIIEAVESKGQFNIIHLATGLKVDVAIRGDDAFDKLRFERSRKAFHAEKIWINFSSPEDVIIMKMRYYKMGASEKHIRDIMGMLKILGDEVDKNYVMKWAKNFEVEDVWQKILKEAE